MRQRNADSYLKQIIFYTVLAVAAVVIITLLYLKNKPDEYYERTEYLLGTYVTVKVSSKNVSPVLLADAAFREITRIDESYGHMDSGKVSAINNSDASGTVIDEETAFLLRTALDVAENTKGAFDPTIYPLTVLWGFDDVANLKRIPSDLEIDETLKKIGYSNIVFDEKDDFRVYLREGALVDLSGIAKGYSVDVAIGKIKSMDESATGFIDAGGDIGVIGPKFGKRPWTIGIRHPRSDRADEVIDYVYLYDGAIATSGDYERYFIEDGIRYFHIFDHETGRPVRSGVTSSTIISNSAMLADAYATAAFVLGKGPGITFLPRYGALALLVMEDMTTYKSPGFEVYQKK